MERKLIHGEVPEGGRAWWKSGGFLGVFVAAVIAQLESISSRSHITASC